MGILNPKDIIRFIGIEKLYQNVTGTVPKKKSSTKDSKDILLFVGAIYGHMIDAIKQYQKQQDVKYRLAIIVDKNHPLDEITKQQLDRIDIVIECNTKDHLSIARALIPYRESFAAISCRPETYIPMLGRIIPNVPYLYAPTVNSLRWTTDKIVMRNRLEAFDSSSNPRYAVIEENSKSAIKCAVEKVGFPLIVKPSVLAASRLVSICYHQEELDQTLKHIFKHLDSVHKKTGGSYEPRVLIEQFMEGQMYSVDAYVDRRGRISLTPMVYVKTGKQIGFDDFFGYSQITPTQLQPASIQEANMAAASAIYALALRNTTVHVELMRTEEGWKIIEAGPRMGGFRHMMYEHSYGMNHVMNDLFIRMGKKPIIPKKAKGYCVAMKFFAKKEGRLKALTGIKKAQALKSCKRLYVNQRVGEMCKFAKHGGTSVFNIILFNKNRSELLADVRRLEKMIHIETE